MVNGIKINNASIINLNRGKHFGKMGKVFAFYEENKLYTVTWPYLKNRDTIQARFVREIPKEILIYADDDNWKEILKQLP